MRASRKARPALVETPCRAAETSASPVRSLADIRCAACHTGAKRIVVTPYFLGPGRHWQEDIPTLAAEAAAKHPGTEFLIAAPLGLHPLVVEALHARMEHCVQQAAAAGSGAEPVPCDVCGAVAGRGPCEFTEAAAPSL